MKKDTPSFTYEECTYKDRVPHINHESTSESLKIKFMSDEEVMNYLISTQQKDNEKN